MAEFTKQGGISRLQARAKFDVVKIHGENSPDVLNGSVATGHREIIQAEAGEQLIELTYSQCVEMFGQEQADLLWVGIPDEERT